MTPRLLWFVAGTTAGAYASVKARRAAYRVSMPGLIDQAGALGEGLRAFSAEVRAGMVEHDRVTAQRVHEQAQALVQTQPLVQDPTDHRARLPERDT